MPRSAPGTLVSRQTRRISIPSLLDSRSATTGAMQPLLPRLPPRLRSSPRRITPVLAPRLDVLDALDASTVTELMARLRMTLLFANLMGPPNSTPRRRKVDHSMRPPSTALLCKSIRYNQQQNLAFLIHYFIKTALAIQHNRFWGRGKVRITLDGCIRN